MEDISFLEHVKAYNKVQAEVKESLTFVASKIGEGDLE